MCVWGGGGGGIDATVCSVTVHQYLFVSEWCSVFFDIHLQVILLLSFIHCISLILYM